MTAAGDFDVAVEHEVRRLARELLPRSSWVAAQVTDHVLQYVPELARTGQPDSVAVVQESTEQNIGAMLAMLAFDITPQSVEPPEGTRELLAAIVAGGGDPIDLLRAYRVGHERLSWLWSDHVREHVRARVDVVGVLQLSSRHLFDIIDRISRRIVAEHVTRGDAEGARGAATRTELVAELLAPGPVDTRAVGSALGYDLSRHHVALLASATDDRTDLRREIERVIAAARVPALVVPSGQGEWWAWLGWADPPCDDDVDRLAAVAVTGAVVGVGGPGHGRDGFGRAHRRAVEAERTRRLSARPRDGVVRHRDVEVAALLCRDTEAARRAALDRLGPLAGPDETATRLRETVRALLAHGHHRGLAATALNVHHKTVAYRLAQAEALLGRSLAQDTFDLEAALVVHATLYGD